MVSCGEKCISFRLIKGIMTLAANKSTKVYYFLGFLVGFFREESSAHVSPLMCFNSGDFHIATIRMVSVTASLSLPG